MVHHATSARNEVGRALLPVLPHASLQSVEQQSEDFPYLIFYFSFVIEITSPRNSRANQTSTVLPATGR